MAGRPRFERTPDGRRLVVSRTVEADPDAVWDLLTDTTRWPDWGPSVAGVPATAHRVEPRGADCLVAFEIPLVAAPYALVRDRALVPGATDPDSRGYGTDTDRENCPSSPRLFLDARFAHFVNVLAHSLAVTLVGRASIVPPVLGGRSLGESLATLVTVQLARGTVVYVEFELEFCAKGPLAVPTDVRHGPEFGTIPYMYPGSFTSVGFSTESRPNRVPAPGSPPVRDRDPSPM